ncbi:F-box domain-containing protein [Pleurostoma richardsiae]|uniref:F-box domain-containing protein n=1 Tax=Pleurostoma richardsiae TaxID=41990 RepID=A0AA38S7S0_9PEZI|nr:F-box domain-containing protein [Pleurostoma richardsiae]
MDPLHITEFASQRYFEKIKQLKDQQESQTQIIEGPSVESSQFILPIRGAEALPEVDEAFIRPGDFKRHEKEKKSLFGRLRHSKSSLEPQDLRRTSVTDSTVPKRLPFDQLFLSLPNELQVQIIASLPLSDVLNLRLASRAWHEMITINEAPIVRYHLDHHIPAYATRLYPIPDPTAINFHYLCGIWHRLHVAAKLAYLMCEWITKEIFLRTSEVQRQEFAPQRERMRRRLIPLLFTIFHFFETYRTLHLKYIREHGHGLERQPYTLNPIEVEIMSMYDDRTLLQVHQVFPLVVSSFCRRLRPPSYVGRVERTVRGYLREKPPDEVHVAVLCLGGLRQVERFWEVKGYNMRRAAVDVWYNAIAHPKEQQQPKPAEPTSKPRRGLMGLRKKSSMAVKEVAKSQTTTDTSMPRRGSVDATNSIKDVPSGLIFNTSLAAGMPMGPLSRDDYSLLLSDLPILQKLWLATAEALILDRKIVERPIDIKRNAQVMLELIREDGIAEEDEWWYGRGTPDSIRPPLEAIEEDPIE